MNRHTQSAECIHGLHSACDYEDCACRCHLVEHVDREEHNDDHEEDE